jgi:hypothetical protein
MDRSILYRLSRNVSLLTIGNPKIIKSINQGYATAGLSLAPAWESGHNTCPNHSTECSAACLFFSGRGAMKKVQAARIKRTKMFFEDRDGFLQLLNSDIYQFHKNATDLSYKVALRLNILSDIRWERHGIPQRWPGIQFYDYSRIPNRKNLPPNYHLTFSWDSTKVDFCRKALANGMNVAVPFKKKPTSFLGYSVIDGDDDDLRFLEPSPNIVALRPKGRLLKQPDSLFLGDNHPHLCG